MKEPSTPSQSNNYFELDCFFHRSIPMAALVQAPYGKIKRQYVEAKDFELQGSGWRHPTAEDPTAEFISGQHFIVKTRINVDPSVNHRVVIGFDMSKTKDSFGWEKAIVRMHAQLGEDTDGQWEHVKDQFDALKPKKKGTIFATFDLKSTLAKELIFTFRIHVEQDVGLLFGGLKFYGASVANPTDKK